MAEEVRRRRTRRVRVEDGKLVERALKFHQRDEADRTQEMNNRLQRYAKYRMWRDEGFKGPWDGASNLALSDMMTQSQRVKDTLYNAVITTRPVLLSKATNPKDKDKVDLIDATLDYQLLVENREGWVSDLLDDFVDDGHFTAFLPWVKDWRYVSTVYDSPPIPEEVIPAEYFLQLIQNRFPEMAGIEPLSRTPEDSWDWKVQLADGTVLDVSFYTGEEDAVEMRVVEPRLIFDGPKVIVKDRADVLHPANASNLQAPGPSNPGGAGHVILVDRPSVDEIERLWRQGRYDRLTKEDIEGLKAHDRFEGESETTRQKAVVEGAHEEEVGDIPGEQKHVTRLMVFDVMALNRNQPPEDVFYIIIKEAKKLCRFRRLSEDFPSTNGSRPFAEQSFVPVKGRRIGIGLLEMIESLHDAKKMVLDMGVNHGSLLLSPFFFYRPSSSIKPEVIRIYPGEGYPLSSPKDDVNFPTIPSQGQAFSVNAYTLFDREEERVTMVGDFQLGRVPQGKASALRTVQGMEMIAGQGEERPERILRRLFHGLGQIWSMTHDLNRHFLSGEKRIRIALPLDPGEDAYRTVTRDGIDSIVEFEFTANAFNVSRTAAQQALAQLGPILVSPVMIQAGIVTADHIYQYVRDVIRSWGQDPEKYVSPPSGETRITAKEAIAKIADGQMPMGVPHESPMRHLQILQKFAAQDLFGYLGQKEVKLFVAWVQEVQMLLQQFLNQQQMLMMAAGGPGGGGGGKPGPEGGPPGGNENPQVSPNEMLDETLPTSGGGANTGMPMQ